MRKGSRQRGVALLMVMAAIVVLSSLASGGRLHATEIFISGMKSKKSRFRCRAVTTSLPVTTLIRSSAKRFPAFGSDV